MKRNRAERLASAAASPDRFTAARARYRLEPTSATLSQLVASLPAWGPPPDLELELELELDQALDHALRKDLDR